MNEEIPMMAAHVKERNKVVQPSLSTAVPIPVPIQEDDSSEDDDNSQVDYRNNYNKCHPYYNQQLRFPQLKVTGSTKRRSLHVYSNVLTTQNLLKSIRSRDISKVKHELDNDPKLATYTNDVGVSALEEAVKSGSVEIVEIFLKKVDTGSYKKLVILENALLYSIKENHIDIVKYLLKQRAKICSGPLKKTSIPTSAENGNNSAAPSMEDINFNNMKKNKDKYKTWTERRDAHIPEFEDAEYAPFITPIVLAAKLERLEIIDILIEQDASEIHPITMECPFVEGTCEICTERKVFKSRRNLEDSNRLLEIYKALSSPGYIFLSGVTDPILEVFELAREMEQMKNEDPSFKFEYDAIAKRCKVFAQEMLDLCRTTEEVQMMLRRSDGVKQCNSVGHQTELPRLLVALHFQQKEFIAHPYCQQVLQKSWYEGLPDWVCNSEKHYLMLFLYVMLWVPLWPIASLLYMLKVWPCIVREMKYPVNKFITDTLSYISFLVLLLLNDIFYVKNSHDFKAGDIYTIIEFLIIIWIVGMSSRQIKMIYRHRHGCWTGYRIFSTGSGSSSRGFDIIILLFFWIWIILRLIGIVYAHIERKADLPRKRWENFHPILISEAFFAAATVLSFFKLTGLFKASNSIGPLQISLKRMISDVVRFLIIFIVIMTGFVIAITKIYSAYKHNQRIDMLNNDMREQSDRYIGFDKTYTTLFWNVFGYGEVFDSADIVVDYTYNYTKEPSMATYNSSSNITQNLDYHVAKHKFTEGVGYFLIGSYHVVAIIVLLNMLIAMMANSYNVIERDSDLEWKFARTRLRMTYYSEVGALPAPFNIMIIGSIMKFVVRKFGSCSDGCKKMDDKYLPKKQSDEAYWELMKKLHTRFKNRKIVQNKKKVSISCDKLEEILKSNRSSINQVDGFLYT